MDILPAYACLAENDFIGLPQIQLVLSGPFSLAIQRFPVFRPKGLPKFLHHFTAHFKAVPAAAGTHTGNQILRFCAKGFLHGIHRHLTHAFNRSPPSGMAEPNGPVYRIQQVQGHTVRIKGHQGKPRHICNQPVDVPVIPFPYNTLSRILQRHSAQVDRMGLVGHHHAVPLHSQGGCHTRKVFQHILRRVSSAVREIHGGKFSPAGSAHAGGKTIDGQPGIIQRLK